MHFHSRSAAQVDQHAAGKEGRARHVILVVAVDGMPASLMSTVNKGMPYWVYRARMPLS